MNASRIRLNEHTAWMLDQCHDWRQIEPMLQKSGCMLAKLHAWEYEDYIGESVKLAK